MLPLLDEIGEQDYSKWTSYGSTGFVQIEDVEYFSRCSAQLLLNSSVDEEFVHDVNQRFEDTNVYHLVESLLREIMPSGCHAMIIDIYMGQKLF